MKKILTIFGTRPELIKLSRLISLLDKDSDIKHVVCNTGQHADLLSGLFKFFRIVPKYDLKIMKDSQALSDLTSRLITSLSDIIQKEKPDLVVVHGDTTSCFTGALAAFYNKIPVAHVEAGLRTGDIFQPFPEEANRIMVDSLSSLLFTPTYDSALNLTEENISPEKIKLTGNTAIDTILHTSRILKYCDIEFTHELQDNKKLVLVTAHRRESFDGGIENICQAIKEMSSKIKDVEFLFSVHPNPKVKSIVQKILGGCNNVILSEPMEYQQFVLAMEKSHLILTDSGGIQEEAPSLNKPVLVLRDKTERPEGVKAGALKIIGTDKEGIINNVIQLLSDEKEYEKMSQATNPYGDGDSSEIILEEIRKYLNLRV